MPRNMSFMATVEQFKDRTKTVTRRQGWKWLKAGDLLMGVEKGMGLKKGETMKRLGLIRVVSVERESIGAISPGDVIREGFPGMTPLGFVKLYCEINKCRAQEQCTRIEFEYVDGEGK